MIIPLELLYMNKFSKIFLSVDMYSELHQLYVSPFVYFGKSNIEPNDVVERKNISVKKWKRNYFNFSWS